MTGNPRQRLLVFIVAYNAEKTIQQTLGRIPARLLHDYDVEVLVIDDSSTDQTFDQGEVLRRDQTLPFTLSVLFNPENQGYGGNQKIGFHYAIQYGFDFVALIHGDGQYAPECLPELIEPLATGQADAVFGSRMMRKGDARRGGMPLYKFIGNRILTWTQNRLLGAHLTEWHSGYRLYSASALRRIPFHRNSNVFHFDTEIIIQLLLAGLRIREIPIPTYYGDEISRVNGIVYAKDAVMACVKARAQELSIFYDRKFDCRPAGAAESPYTAKLDFESPHTLARDRITPNARVLDIGCAGGYLGDALRTRGCHTTGIDAVPLGQTRSVDAFYLHDLNERPFPLDLEHFDYAIMLDVIEHLGSPENFVDDFLAAASRNRDLKLAVSTGNVAFIIVRLMLLLGQFNYGKRGILDLTHTRLFTFATFRRLFEQSGFEVLEMRGVPAPFPLAVGNGLLGRFLIAVNKALMAVSRSLFAYQIFAVVRPKPTLTSLLERAQRESGARAASLTGAPGSAPPAEIKSVTSVH
ncbi:MAG TPA: bifunctional glycosyltransferase/class I SAM-dependent methyltransferase [Vicinamibacterales bacterium]|nr:bifunctional glycosyltransferase/class I SAM-dependent methyltransferase [Vicinamibacterales bacterium]